MDSKRVETLANYVRRVRAEKRLSLTEVKRQSRGLISDAYVSRIENGHSPNPSPRMLRALAAGLRVPEEELFNAARGLPPHEPDGLERQVLEMMRELPDGARADFVEILRTLHRRHGLREVEDNERPKGKTKRRSA